MTDLSKYQNSKYKSKYLKYKNKYLEEKHSDNIIEIKNKIDTLSNQNKSNKYENPIDKLEINVQEDSSLKNKFRANINLLKNNIEISENDIISNTNNIDYTYLIDKIKLTLSDETETETGTGTGTGTDTKKVKKVKKVKKLSKKTSKKSSEKTKKIQKKSSKESSKKSSKKKIELNDKTMIYSNSNWNQIAGKQIKKIIFTNNKISINFVNSDKKLLLTFTKQSNESTWFEKFIKSNLIEKEPISYPDDPCNYKITNLFKMTKENKFLEYENLEGKKIKSIKWIGDIWMYPSNKQDCDKNHIFKIECSDSYYYLFILRCSTDNDLDTNLIIQYK